MDDRLLIQDDVDTAVIGAYEITRRDAVRRGLLTGGTALGASMVPTLLAVRDAFAVADGDAAILASAITLENTVAAAYDAALAGGRLSARLRAVAARFARHERDHAAALGAALRRLGGTPPTGTAAGRLAPLRRAGTEEAIVRFAIDLEMMALAAYYDASRKLRAPDLLRTGVSIMADEGQHLVVLRQAIGRNPAPRPFEDGTTNGR